MYIRPLNAFEKAARRAGKFFRKHFLSGLAVILVPLLVFANGSGPWFSLQPVQAREEATATPPSVPEDPAAAQPEPPATAPQPVKPDTYVWPTLEEALTTTGATPPPGVDRGRTITGAASRLLSVPPYVWYNGCVPTSAGMVLAFWDGRGFDKLLPGDPTTQSDAINQALASDEHYNDYALPLDDLEHSASLLADKSEDPVGDEHADNSIADYMKTSQSKYQLRYGWSSSRFISDAYKNYIQSVAPDYAVTTRFFTMNDGFTWEMYKGEIDGNRPVMLVVDTDGDGETDHAGVGVGYDEAAGQMMAVYDTWDTEVHWYEFKKMDVGEQWGIFGGVLFDLGVYFQVDAPNDEPDINIGDGICKTASNTCTLRAAVQEANATVGHDVILLPNSTYVLTRSGQNENAASTGDLDVTESLTIQGASKELTIIDGNQLDAVFSVGDVLSASASAAETQVSAAAISGMFFVEFSGVTIRNGKGGVNAWGSGYLDLTESNVLDNQRAGVWSTGTNVTLTQTAVSNNQYPGFVGGVRVNAAMLNVHASTIHNNSGVIGGVSADSGILMTESTVSSNKGSSGAGGISLTGSGAIVNSTIAKNTGTEGGGITTEKDLVLINATLAENTANGSGGQNASGLGGGILAKADNEVILNDTIISKNTSAGAPDCSGNFLSGGYNLIGNSKGCTLSAGPGDLIGANANLGDLAANGGPTLTYALLPGSAAIDAGDPLGCTDQTASPLLHDQRFLTRPRDGSGKGVAICDIGAYEGQDSPVTPYPTSTPATGTPPATNTPCKTPTPVCPGPLCPTPTPVCPSPICPTPTPVVTATPHQPSCSEAIVNGGFEKDEAWVLPVTEYRAGYDTIFLQEAVANYSSDEAHSGGRSMRTGIVDAAKNVYSYSSAWQQVSIPANATSAKLSFWILPKAINGLDGYDVQLMLILDTNKREIERPVNVRLDSGNWTSYEFDLKKYAGKSFWVYFGTYNNGWGGTMSMYTDDASLMICKP